MHWRNARTCALRKSRSVAEPFMMCIFVCVIFEGGAPGSYENTHNMLVMTHPQAPQNWIETLATADMVVGVGERQRSSEGGSDRFIVYREMPTRKMSRLGSQSKHQNETKSETNMVLAPVLFLRNKLRPASGRFPVSRNETKVQIARFVSISSLNPCFCIVPWAPYGKASVRGGACPT